MIRAVDSTIVTTKGSVGTGGKVSERKTLLRAFTLIEVVVMSAVGMMLMAMAYSFFLSSAKDGTKTSKKLQSIQATVICLERFLNDIKQSFYLKGRYEPQLIYTGTKANGITFFKISPRSFPPDTENPLEFEPVTYQFSPVTSQIYINNKPFGAGRFKYVEFSLEEANIDATPPVFGNTVTVNIVSVSDEDLGTKLEDIDKREASTQVATFCFRQQAFSKFYDKWVFYKALVQKKGE